MPNPPKNTVEPVTFEAPQEGLMEAWMAQGAVSLKKKFEGAPPAAHPGREAKAPNTKSPDTGFDRTLDLHGKTRKEAIAMVQNFVLTAHQAGLRRVLIITGKGHHTKNNDGVLGPTIHHWLTKNGARYAKHFDWAPPEHGGTGAIVVELRG